MRALPGLAALLAPASLASASLALASLALASLAAAATIGPIIDLPLAALVGARDPDLPAARRQALTALADGDTVADRRPIRVTARAITCRESNVAIGDRSCELTFGTRKVTLTGLKAHEMAATLKEAGAASEGAAGSIYTGLTDLRCTVSPLEVLAKAGGGAPCSFGPAT